MKDITFMQKLIGKQIKIYVVNGYKMSGWFEKVEEDYCIFYDKCYEKKQIIFWHAISTIEAPENIIENLLKES